MIGFGTKIDIFTKNYFADNMYKVDACYNANVRTSLDGFPMEIKTEISYLMYTMLLS